METNHETPESQEKPISPDPPKKEEESQTEEQKKTSGRGRWIIVGLVLLILVGLFVAKWAERFSPEHFQRLLAEGQIDMSRGQWEQAAGKLEQVVEHDPNLLAARIPLAKAYLKLKKYSSAAREFEEVIKRDSKDPQYHFLLGVSYQMMDQHEPALIHYRIAAEMIPQNYGIFMNVGMIHFKTQNYINAQKAFEHVIQIKPDYFPAYFRLAEVYEAAGKAELAVKEYQTIKKRVGNNPEAGEILKEADRRLALLTRKAP